MTALKEERFTDGGKFAVMFPYRQISCVRKCYINFGHPLTPYLPTFCHQHIGEKLAKQNF